MHIPDGFLDTKTAISTGVLSVAAVGFALRHAKRSLPPRKVPLLGLSAAFVFAAQLINFPVAGGTSGHLLGGVLVGALLGPSAAVIVLTTVLILQCFAFADGGITSLGANIFNMAVLGGAVGGVLYRVLTRWASSLFGRLFAAIVVSWIVVMLAAMAAAGELSLSGTVNWQVAFPAMAGVHALIGLGEGVITALVLSAIASTKPDLVLHPETGEAKGAGGSLMPLLVFGVLASAGLALFVLPYASQLPDGLEWVAGQLHFEGHEREHAALFQKYTPVAALVATLGIFLFAWLVARAMLARKAAVPAAQVK